VPAPRPSAPLQRGTARRERRAAQIAGQVGGTGGRGRCQYTLDTIRQEALPFAVSVTSPRDYTGMDGETVRAQNVDLVARFYIESIMHTARYF
jgi:2-methylaconitate cis-trans-isomerase PrpF